MFVISIVGGSCYGKVISDIVIAFGTTDIPFCDDKRQTQASIKVVE
ncbi:hypothetical protein [Idiomarina sp.]